MAVDYESAVHLATITINRPQARNAIDADTANAIEQAIDRAESDERVRVLILAGAPPVFCAGADLRAVRAGEGGRLSTERGGFAGLARRGRTKPLIAAVDGAALAGGTELVLACDLVVASRAASFGLPEVRRGLIAGAGALFRLGERLPANIAMACALTGDPLGAEAAHEYGLVNELCEPGQALAVAGALGERIAVNAPLAVSISRQTMLDSSGVCEARAWELTDAANAAALASEDVKEGVAAFLEKRAPIWRGR